MASQQLVKDDAEAVDVGGNTDRPARYLLRRGVLRRHRPKLSSSRVQVGGAELGIEHLCDTEIEKLRLAVVLDHDVRRFQVAVYHLYLMRGLHGPANLPNDDKPFPQIEVTLVAVAVKRHPGDVLHDKIRKPFVGGPAAQKIGDVRMVKGSQDLPFAAKTLEDEVGIHTALYQFDRHGLIELTVDPFGQIDGAHSTPADLFGQPVNSDRAPDQRVWGTVLGCVHLG